MNKPKLEMVFEFHRRDEMQRQQKLTPPVASTLEEAINQARGVSKQTPHENQLSIIRRYLSDKSEKYSRQ